MTTAMTEVLSPTAIAVGAVARDQVEAIEQVGAILVGEGLVKPAYIDAMRAREAIISTYLGNGIALPHGTSEAKDSILRTGLAVVQFPGGVPWGEEPARLVIGLAARSEEHVGILARLAGVLEDADLCQRLARTADPLEIHRALTSDAGIPAPRAEREPFSGVSRTIRVANPSGLHARPAAEIVQRVMDYDADVFISAGDRLASALSITQLIALGTNVGEEITVTASGAEAHDALDAVLAIVLAAEGWS